jgi:hypothetical protein
MAASDNAFSSSPATLPISRTFATISALSRAKNSPATIDICPTRSAISRRLFNIEKDQIQSLPLTARPMLLQRQKIEAADAFSMLVEYERIR